MLTRTRIVRALAGATLLAALVTATAPGATSTLIVAMDVPSVTTVTNQCTQRPAWSLGTVLPDSPATTSTGSDVCRIRFSSSNDSSALRMWQSDRENTAMARADAAWDVRSGDVQQLTGIDVGPAGKVIAYGGGGAWRTSTNSGASFPTVGTTAGGSGQTIDDVDVLESTPSTVWASGHNGTVRHSGDGGATWSNTPTGSSEHFYATLVESTTTAIVGGTGGQVLRTTDTGSSWTPGVSGVGGVADFARRASNDYWLVGANNSIRRSSDGGLTWNAIVGTPTPWSHWDSIELTGVSTVWIAGNSGGHATISRSPDNGATWANRSSNLGISLLDMVAVSDTEAWVAGIDGTLLHTTTSGLGWTRHDPPTTSSIAGIALATDGSLVLATMNDEVYRTTDGNTFTVGYDGNTTVPLSDVDVVDNDRRTLVAVGDGGYIRRSTDRGTNWTTVGAAVTSAHLTSVSLSPERGVGWAVGHGGVILRTTNNGSTWATQTSPTGQHLMSVDAVTDKVAWAVGRTGTVIRTTDGGSTWTTIPAGTTEQLFAVSALDANTAWVGGTAGVIRATTNGGGAWASRDYPGGSVQYDLHAVSATVVQASNEWPGYIASTDGGVTWSDGMFAGGRKAAVWERDRPVAMGLYYGDTMFTADLGATWNWHGSAGTYTFMRSGAPLDANRMVMVGENEVINVSRIRDPIIDYGGAGSTWASPASGLFGVCLQDVGVGTTPVWVEDTGNISGRCEPLAGDIWSAVPQAPTTIATTTQGTDAYVDLVWGLRPAANQPPGQYTATVSFEAIAPAA